MLKGTRRESDSWDSRSGAHLSDPSAHSAKVRVPPDVQIVLYCSSPNQLTSARTALALRRKGISNVWVLEGGLKAWRELGLPVTMNLSSPAEVAAGFGIDLPKEKFCLRQWAFIDGVCRPAVVVGVDAYD